LRQIVRLTTVDIEITKFPRLVVGRPNQFPVLHLNGTALRALPRQQFMSSPSFAAEDRKQTSALHGCRMSPLKRRRVFDAGDVEARCHDIDDVPGLTSKLTTVSDDLWPADDQRRADAAFVRRLFVIPQRRVACRRPGDSVTGKSVVRSRYLNQPQKRGVGSLM
jgi:hypothetical protein